MSLKEEIAMGKSIRLREQQQIWRPSGCDRFASMMVSSHVAIFERFESLAVLNLILPQAELKEVDLKLRIVPFMRPQDRANI